MKSCLLLVALFVLPVSLAFTADKDKTSEFKAVAKADPGYVHTVIFYIKKDAPKDEADALIKDAYSMLAKIPTVRLLKIGLPAEKATPKLAVTDYQVGLVIFFDNYDGLKEYLEHADHVKYVDKHMKHLDKIVVYDFINSKK